MAYVVVVFAIINVAALVGTMALLWYIRREYPLIVGTVIQDEVRRQDDRIEKRLAKVQGASGETVANDFSTGYTDVLRPGVPMRRNTS